MKKYKRYLNKRDPFDREILKLAKKGILKVGITPIRDKNEKNPSIF